MPFDLSEATPNFQKTIDMIHVKPVLGHFVSVYMDDVIITSPSFTEHVYHLNQVFTLLRDAGLILNKDKCCFARDKLKYLGLIIIKDGIKTDDNKVKNVVTDVLSRNPVDNVEGSQILCAALRALALNSREQLIQEQRKDPELGHIYRYLENPEDGSVKATVCEGRKIITLFCKLVLVTDGAEYVGGNIEKLFDEARQNMQRQHKTWEKYYNRQKKAVNIKVNDLVLVQTHFIRATGRRVVGKFMPKFEGPYKVLEVQKNNLTIWKRGEERSQEMLTNKSNSEKSRRSRKPSGNENKSCKLDKGNAGLEDLRVKRNKAVKSTGTSERYDGKRPKICRRDRVKPEWALSRSRSAGGPPSHFEVTAFTKT
ncbi:uncharacterized protein TNCV_3249991 [Trichonephila clavipes]|nr:uncharacterized protein TNCV_3249991 [Trichonephila clavipes]